MREKERFALESRGNQQKTYDNETGEHTSGQRPLLIQDWQTHLENKERGSDKRVGGVGACAHRLVKGEQRDKDNEQVIKDDQGSQGN